MRGRAWLGAGAMVVAASLAFYLYPREAEVPGRPATVLAERYVAAEGKVEALDGYEVEIGSGLIARLASFPVKEGEAVRKGEVIATLEDADIAAGLEQAQAELAVEKARLAEVASGARAQEIDRARAAVSRARAERELAAKELKRIKDLFREGTVSQSRMDEAKSRFEVAAARMKEANEELRLLEAGPKPQTLEMHRAQVLRAEAAVAYYRALMAKTRILAPISGLLIKRYLDEGEIVHPEIAIGAIADADKVRINAEVDETDIGKLHPGDPAEITSRAYPGRVFRAKVESIADYAGSRQIKPNNPAVNLGLKVVQVKIALLEPHPLRLGMTVDVRITPGGGAPGS